MGKYLNNSQIKVQPTMIERGIKKIIMSKPAGGPSRRDPTSRDGQGLIFILHLFYISFCRYCFRFRGLWILLLVLIIFPFGVLYLLIGRRGLAQEFLMILTVCASLSCVLDLLGKCHCSGSGHSFAG